MAVNPVSSTTTQDSSINLTKSDDLDKQAFLELLTTQLKYQDPLNPMENTEFVAQLAQFSSLEQLWNVNSTLQTNSQLTQAMHNSMISSLIGKEIYAHSDNLDLQDGEPAQFSYYMDDTAEASLIVYDADGNVVNRIDLGAQEAGAHDGEWDGTNMAGDRMSPGSYTFRVVAKTGENEETPVDTYMRGVVSAVQFANGQTTLMVGNAPIYLNDVLQIKAP
jgi:flagellar basal-body rod modification protein FlgD